MRTVSLKVLSWYMAIAAIVAEYTVSANLLTDLGSSYVSDGGLLIEKIHPGSYLAVLAGLLRTAHEAGRHDGMRRWVAKNGPLGVFLSGMVFCSTYALACTGTGGVIALVDSFLPAGMLAMALCDLTAPAVRRLRALIQFLLVLNTIVALAEFFTQAHLVPVSLSGGDATSEFRPAAFYDHPLTGSTATMMGLFLRPNSAEAPFLAAGFVTILIAALLAFGERAPILLAMASMAMCYAGRLGRRMLRRQIGWRDGAPVILAALLAVLATGAASAGGFGSRLGTHLYWDASAQVRMNEFGILQSLTTPELLFGCERSELLALIEPLRLTGGVGALENFWLVMLTTLGALCFPIFVAALLGLLVWLWRLSDCQGRMMIVTLILAASASNSLGRKSTLLISLVACVVSARRPAHAVT
jgi:hypothetical protein